MNAWSGWPKLSLHRRIYDGPQKEIPNSNAKAILKNQFFKTSKAQ